MRKAVSLFTGGGGLDLGLEAAGFDVVLASDIDPHSCASLVQNKENSALRGKPFLKNASIVERDILNLTSDEILATTGLKKGELDLLAGGPPCQAFSIFGRRKGRSDPRGLLAYEYLRILSELAPKAFVFENVFGILSSENGEVFKELTRLLSEPGDGLKYKLSIHRLNSADYGVPQFRDRVFIVGSREGHEIEDVVPMFGNTEAQSSNLIPWRTVKDAFRGLGKMSADGWNNHTGRNHSQRIIDRYEAMSFGERDSKTRINKLNPKRPSFTIIVGSDAGGGKGHIHPKEPREVTPRESARIQTFPDWWWFSGKGRHPIRQVGNAVPSLLGFAVGQALLEDIFQEKTPNFWDAVRLLDQMHLFSSQEIKQFQVLDRDDLRTQTQMAI